MKCCPSCQTELSGPVAACPFCGYRLSGSVIRPGGSSVVRPAVRPKIQCEVDLGAQFDRTGSSRMFATGIPLTYKTIVRQVAAKARSVKCWVGSHGDLDEGQDFIIHTDAGTPEQAIEDVEKIVFDGGGDPDEHHLDAIEALLNLVPWTADPTRARGAMLVFMSSDTKPAKSGVTAAELGRRIKDKGILLYLVCERTATLNELATAAEGLVFQISDSPDPLELQRIAAKLAESIQVSITKGSTVPLTV